MAESEQHRNLVRVMSYDLQEKFPNMRVLTDISIVPGETAVPQAIDGFRPDVYGYCSLRDVHVICEAKTNSDLKSKHTLAQLEAFIQYLGDKPNSLFVLGVYGTQSAALAKTILRIRHANSSVCSLYVYDGLDYWEFKYEEASKWLLC